MIKISDSITLARTKFKIRRIRLTLSLIMISLLCSILILGYIALERSAASLNEFSNQGLNGRYLVSVSRWNGISVYDKVANEELFSEAESLYKKSVEEEKKTYKEYGIDYYEDLSQAPTATYGGSDEKYFNFGSKYANQVIVEFLQSNYPVTKTEQIKLLLKEYGAINKYTAQPFAAKNGSFTMLQNGQEPETQKVINDDNYQKISSYVSYMNSVDDDLANPFIGSDYKLEKNEIPILVNYEIAEKFLGLKPIDTSATEQEKYDRIQELRKRVSEESRTFCWRNDASKALYATALIANNDKNSNVRYNLGNDTCSTPTVKEDKRSTEEVLLEKENTKLQKELGQYEEPASKFVTVRPIGVMPDMPDSMYMSDVKDFLQAMTSSTLDRGSAIVPRDLYEKNVEDEVIKDIFEQKTVGSSFMEILFGSDAYIAEFSTADEMREFIKDVDCASEYCGPDVSLKVETFSNNAAIIYDTKNYAMNIFLWVLLASSVVITLLIYIVINRILADSRKETSVFRAIGYSRFEISQIYIMYIALFSSIVSILTTIISAVVVMAVKSIYEPQASLYFTNFFALDQTKDFVIVDFSILIPLIGVPVFVIGIIASIIPLIINTHRSPLKNLRAE
mgnify:CR=1 FL=1